MADLSLSSPLPTSPRHFSVYWSAFAILSGLVDPLMGVFVKIASIFWWPRLPAKADTPRRRKRGLLLVLGGIEGPSPYNHAMACGMLRSRYRGAVVRFGWNRGIPFLRSLVNLMSRCHHARQTARLVERIVSYKCRYPDAPVNLLAQSGGCWIVLKALEQLPVDIRVDSAVLIAPSISPDYDITCATSRCASGLVSIGGPGDFFFLGVGTTLFGTSNRVHSPSAGWIGWHHHPAGFREVRWHPRWLRYGYFSNHTSSSSQALIQYVVAPLLTSRDQRHAVLANKNPK
ncbi:MAG TPA: hypothetical protein VJZ71_07445 [Phycisphaerae bacterium]|nr:hypothetical protein [Phycisphaerae bacterium]